MLSRAFVIILHSEFLTTLMTIIMTALGQDGGLCVRREMESMEARNLQNTNTNDERDLFGLNVVLKAVVTFKQISQNLRSGT